MSRNADPCPLVSIALATYNAGAYLGEQMDSLLAQSYPQLEIVVSDDGSTDDTRARLARYAAADARVRLLPQQDRLGFNGNFARCFAACRGAYISPCDQDDRWHPEKTARLLAACQRHGGAAYCDSTFIDDAGRPLRQQGRARFSELKVMQSDPPALRLLFSNCVSGHALMFPRALLAQVGVVPEGGYFDWAIALAARVNDLPLTYLDQPLVAYRRHPAAVTVSGPPPRAAGKAARLWALRWAMLGAALAHRGVAPTGLPSPLAFQSVLKAWLDGYCCPAMVRTLLPHRHQVLPERTPAARLLTVLGLFWGYRLRALIRPRRYPAIRRIGQRVEFVNADSPARRP